MVSKSLPEEGEFLEPRRKPTIFPFSLFYGRGLPNFNLSLLWHSPVDKGAGQQQKTILGRKNCFIRGVFWGG